jgi:hypothetical protein
MSRNLTISRATRHEGNQADEREHHGPCIVSLSLSSVMGFCLNTSFLFLISTRDVAALPETNRQSRGCAMHPVSRGHHSKALVPLRRRLEPK